MTSVCCVSELFSQSFVPSFVCQCPLMAKVYFVVSGLARFSVPPDFQIVLANVLAGPHLLNRLQEEDATTALASLRIEALPSCFLHLVSTEHPMEDYHCTYKFPRCLNTKEMHDGMSSSID